MNYVFLSIKCGPEISFMKFEFNFTQMNDLIIELDTTDKLVPRSLHPQQTHFLSPHPPCLVHRLVDRPTFDKNIKRNRKFKI